MLLNALLLSSLTFIPPDTARPPKRFSVLPFPLVYYTPETRLAYGVAVTATFRFGALPSSGILQKTDSLATTPDKRPSQVTFGAAYTQNKQLLFYIPFQIFSNENRYFFNGEVGYYKYSYYFFGLGQRDVPRELYQVNYPRIRLNAFRRIAGGTPNGPQTTFAGQLYAGVRYQYEDYRVTATEPGGLLASGAVPGGLGSRLSGAGLGLFYDSRDQVFFPTRGIVADVSFLGQRQLLGSTVRFDRYVADVSSYHALAGPTAVLAVNYVVSLTANGLAPFNAMSLLGSGKRLRGYYEGRFRDQNAAILQTELRLAIWKRLGAVVFGSAGILGDSQQLLRVNDIKTAYGGGLRFTFNRRDHVNIRLDYGVGSSPVIIETGKSQSSSGIYVTIGEAF